MNNRLIKNILVIAAVIILIAAAYIIYSKIPSNKYLEAYQKGEKVIILEGEILKDYLPLYYNEEIYLEFEFVKKNINDNLFYNQKDQNLTIITDSKIIKTDSKKTLVLYDGREKYEDYKILIKDEKIYLSVGMINDYFYTNIKEFDNGIIILLPNSKYEYLKTEGEIVHIREKDSIKSPFVDILTNGDEVLMVEEKGDEFIKVLSNEGIVGYVKKNDMSDIFFKETKKSSEFEFTLDNKQNKKLISWRMIYNKIANTENIKISDSVDVIVPTWAKLQSSDGRIVHWITDEYIDIANDNNTDIYLGITNEFSDTTMTKEFLSSTESVDKFISSIIKLTKNKNLPGISIDFENMPLEIKDMFTLFIGKLSYYTNLNDIELFVCTGVMGGSENYSLVYDHEKLGRYADYLMVMAYDEGSTKAPVARLSWVEEKIKDLTEVVNPQKMYLGMPMYTRIWQLEKEQVVDTLVVSINRQNEILLENEDGKMEYNTEYSQKEFIYNKNNNNYLMYIEDNETIYKRIEIYRKNNLAGVFLWEDSFVEEYIKEFIANKLDN